MKILILLTLAMGALSAQAKNLSCQLGEQKLHLVEFDANQEEVSGVLIYDDGASSIQYFVAKKINPENSGDLFSLNQFIEYDLLSQNGLTSKLIFEAYHLPTRACSPRAGQCFGHEVKTLTFEIEGKSETFHCH